MKEMTDKERLEEIKEDRERRNSPQGPGYFILGNEQTQIIKRRDYHWLIERVQELEIYVDESSKKHAALNVFLQERNTIATLGKHVVDAIMQYVQELENKNTKLYICNLEQYEFETRPYVKSLEKEIDGRKKHEAETARNLNILREQNKRYRHAIEFAIKYLENSDIRQIKMIVHALKEALEGFEMNLDELDRLDDDIFRVAYEINELLGLGHDLSKYEHTDLIINVKQSIIEELKRQGEDE